MKHYTLYCASDNGFCSAAETTLVQNNIAFETISVNIANASSDLVGLFAKDATRTPQVFYGTEYVGNLDDIQSLFRSV